jgi:hypothetical protein
VPKLDHEDEQTVIMDLIDDSVISDANTVRARSSDKLATARWAWLQHKCIDRFRNASRNRFRQ